MHTRASSPSITLSTSGSSIITMSALPAIVALSSLDGLDLDLSAGSMRLRPGAFAARAAEARVPIRSVWVSLPDFLERRRGWFNRYDELGWPLVTTGSVETVVVHASSRRRESTLIPVPANIANLRRAVSARTRIAVAIRSSELEGTRDHLAALARLRRYAEEWDLQLAVDLTGRVDPRWEVEAALIRLLPRLSLVRLRLPSSPQSWEGHDRVTSRAVATLTDVRFLGSIAIVPAVGMWQRWWSPAICEAAQASAQALRERFASVEAAMEFESYPEHPYRL